MALVKLEKTIKVPFRLRCSDHRSDVAVSVQIISLQGPTSTLANHGEGARTRGSGSW
jgi:hypothetical protein